MATPTENRTPTDPATETGLNADFSGGPPALFDEVGRDQLSVLLQFGLTPESLVLDIGCGCLRGGKWIIPLLKPGHYFGIEPATAMLDRGLRELAETGMLQLKQPRFDHNAQFDFSVFNDEEGNKVRFTHAIARSVWTHADKTQIEQMVRFFKQNSTPNGVLLASFKPAKWYKRNDYRGRGWIGKSHLSSVSGVVSHSFRWIRNICSENGMTAKRVMQRPVVNGQPWILVAHAPNPCHS